MDLFHAKIFLPEKTIWGWNEDENDEKKQLFNTFSGQGLILHRKSVQTNFDIKKPKLKHTNPHSLSVSPLAWLCWLLSISAH